MKYNDPQKPSPQKEYPQKEVAGQGSGTLPDSDLDIIHICLLRLRKRNYPHRS